MDRIYTHSFLKCYLIITSFLNKIELPRAILHGGRLFGLGLHFHWKTYIRALIPIHLWEKTKLKPSCWQVEILCVARAKLSVTLSLRHGEEREGAERDLSFPIDARVTKENLKIRKKNFFSNTCLHLYDHTVWTAELLPWHVYGQQ